MSRNSDNGFADWGGYMDAKIAKLEEQFSKSSNGFRESNLFNGISICVNGLTNPSADELKRIMMVHGGVYHHYQRSHTKYIIASNLPDVKVRNMNTSKIVSPQWIVDCIKENRILDYTKYLLYTNHKPSQPMLMLFQKNSDNDMKEKNAAIDYVNPEMKSEVESIMRELNVLNEKMKHSPGEEEQSCEKLDIDMKHVEDKNIPNIQPIENVENANAVKPQMDASSPGNCVRGTSEAAVSNTLTKSTRTAVDPKFLNEFYNNSRLHHIATLGAGFKQYISDLRERHSGGFPARSKILEEVGRKSMNKGEKIMHIDMDCFFVSVGLRTRPHLRGLPIAVTHSKGGTEPSAAPGVDRQLEMDLFMQRLEKKLKQNILDDEENTKVDKIRKGFEGFDSLSEIASCSYEARNKGVHNGMFVGQALRLCPNLKTIPYDFEGYKEVAFTLYDTIAQYTLNIEAVSCDEMYVDLTDLLDEVEVDVMDFVEFVRKEIKEKTGCPCSAGIGGNRLQARMATKKAKPNGQYLLSSENVEQYMADIPISDLPGVGYSTSYTLKQNNLVTCADLQKTSLHALQNIVGNKLGETLHKFCRGIDTRPLTYEQVRKSVSAEVNYGIRFNDHIEMENFLKQLSTEVHSRLIYIKRKGKCITLKVMVRSKDAPVETSKFMGHGVCDHSSKSMTLRDFTSDLETIQKTVLNIMKSLNIPPKELRGIGIQISKLQIPAEVKKESDLKDMFTRVMERNKDKNIIVTEKSKEIPEAVVTLQSPDKSPKKVGSKSLKRNGSGKSKSSMVKQTKKSDIASLLQNASKRTKSCVQEQLEFIDMDVLAELPEHIREEVLRSNPKLSKAKIAPNPESADEKNLTKTTKFTINLPEEINVDGSFLEALPLDIREEIEMELLKRKTNNRNAATSRLENTSAPDGNCKVEIAAAIETRQPLLDENIFQRPEWRELLQNWVESTDCPEHYDVEILREHAKELVNAKKAYDLYVPVKFLCRIIGLKNICNWHTAYKSILEVVQSEMKRVYGGPMYLNVKIDCDKCF